MSYGFFELLGDLSGYRPKYLDAINQLAVCQNKLDPLRTELAKAQELIRQLQALVPNPEPPPVLDYIAERDTAWVEAQLLAMKLNIIRLPLDSNYRLTNRKNMLNVVAWDTTDRLQYVSDYFDCDKFAMLFKVMVNLIFQLNQVTDIIDYKSGHSYNLILYPDSEPMVLEPQTDGMYLWTKRITDFYSLEGAWAII